MNEVRRTDLTPSLVEQLRAGSNTAGGLLEDLYRDALVRFSWGYLGTREDAEDAVQDVFCKVLAATEIPASFRSWIYRIARNHCLNLRRDRRRRGSARPLDSRNEVAAALTGNLTRLVAGEDRQSLARALADLSEGERDAVRLRYTEGLSRREIAEVLEVPVSTVKSRLFESLRKLRREVAESEDTGPA